MRTVEYVKRVQHVTQDGQVAEVVGLVALQLLTGAFNLVAGIERWDASQ